ncbi:MAG: methyltransferase domain-containing protein [Elainellaceae cyanobacterium]
MPKTLQQQIQIFYDASSGLWEQVWGEHMHHGYYGPAGTERKDRRQAQIDLIEELLGWGGVADATAILDVGCGIGGSSLYLAEKFGATATGITLSPVQARRATERAAAAGLADRTQFQVTDALAMPFADGSFDLVWSMESGEHMPDKTQFLKECHRVLKPGGRFLMATWCHRPIDESPLTAEEQAHLEKIYRVYRLPYIISLAEYEAIAHSPGYQHLRTADWSAAVAPFWNEVVRSAISPAAVVGLLRAGWGTMQAAMSMGLMQSGYRRGLVRFGVMAGVRG